VGYQKLMDSVAHPNSSYLMKCLSACMFELTKYTQVA
jgi:hypothetical protein